jgi:putative SOS response-associated peptidase YedK
MCNLYSITTGQAAIVALTRALRDVTGNLEPMPGVFPDYTAPVVRNAPDGVRELAKLRWGMPSSSQALFKATERRADKLRAKGKEVDDVAFKALMKAEPDKGTTNIRNTKSKHWTRWLGVENRCVVPFTSFSEFNKDAGGDIWFALDETRPLAVFAGIWTNWTSVRKVKDGPTTDDLYGFLTTDANDFMKPIHQKAMPVILTTPAEIEQWMTAPAAEALELQKRVPPNDMLKIVAKGVKKDGADA